MFIFKLRQTPTSIFTFYVQLSDGLANEGWPDHPIMVVRAIIAPLLVSGRVGLSLETGALLAESASQESARIYSTSHSLTYLKQKVLIYCFILQRFLLFMVTKGVDV